MILETVLFVLGLGVLYVGADWLVKGASSIALQFGIRPLMVGLTVVALGTSMPELLINIFAAVEGEDALAVGNVVGSNIANIALILGLTAMILPLTVERSTLLREYPIMLAVTLLFWALSADGTLDRLDGAALIACLLAFMAYIIHSARTRPGEVSADVPELDDGPLGIIQRLSTSNWGRATYVAAGVVSLAFGAKLMVDSAVSIGGRLGVDPGVIGLTVVAIGTSLPELAASLVCAIRKEAEMSVGNVLGSNMLNIMFVVGLVSLVRPLAVDPVALKVHFPIMVGFTLLLFPIAWSRNRISRLEGGILLAGFAGYILYLILPYF